MTILLSRRAVLAGASCLIARAPAFGQDELTQDIEGEGTYWAPIISAFYAEPDQGQATFPVDKDGPPVFPEENIQPPLKFSMNPAPADRAANIDTDWLVYQNRLKNNDQVSAIVTGRDSNRLRLWFHRCFDEEYMAGYTQSRRIYIVANAAVVRERFPIPGEPSTAERPALIREKLKVVGGKLTIEELVKVRSTGAGGEVIGTPLLEETFVTSSLADFVKRPRTEFIPRRETKPVGDLLEGVLKISLDMEFEAGKDLGLTEPERAKVHAEIRIAVGSEYLDFMKITTDNIQIAK